MTEHKEGCNIISCKDGDCDAPKGRLISSSPDCRDGKHTICDSKGWDMFLDQATACPCSCHQGSNHNHITRDIRPPGLCPACDEHHDRAMGVPVCYKRHEPAPGVHQDIPHLNTQCMDRHNILCIGCPDCEEEPQDRWSIIERADEP